MFGKILLEAWQNCMHEFRNSYGEMQQKVSQILNKSVTGDCEFGIEPELEQMHLHPTKSISVKLQKIKLILTPSTNLHIQKNPTNSIGYLRENINRDSRDIRYIRPYYNFQLWIT